MMQKVVFVVRHAEKELARGLQDVPLTAAGRRRAQALLHVPGMTDVSEVYVTPYRRAHETAAYVSERQGVTPVRYPANDVDGVAQRALDSSAAAILIVGHCDTVPEIVARLGVTSPRLRFLSGYGDLFEVRFDGGDARLIRGRFGASS